MNELEFNQKYPVGTLVRYHPVIGQPEFVETETRSEAWTLGSGHVVVKVEGKAGGVSVTSIEVVEQRVQSDACPACDGIAETKLFGITLRCSTCHGSGKRH